MPEWNYEELNDENSFTYYVNYLWDPTLPKSPEYYYELSQTKKNKKEKKKFLYLTLSPDKKIRNLDRTETNLNALVEWCDKWFNKDKKYYNAFHYVIESGSKGDHLHIHAILDMKTTHKHAERLKRSWAKYFPNNQLLTTLNLAVKYKCLKCKTKSCLNFKHRGEYCYLCIDDKVILQDKINYFTNSEKGSHANLIDEHQSGFRGAFTLTNE